MTYYTDSLDATTKAAQDAARAAAVNKPAIDSAMVLIGISAGEAEDAKDAAVAAQAAAAASAALVGAPAGTAIDAHLSTGRLSPATLDATYARRVLVNSSAPQSKTIQAPSGRVVLMIDETLGYVWAHSGFGFSRNQIGAAITAWTTQPYPAALTLGAAMGAASMVRFKGNYYLQALASGVPSLYRSPASTTLAWEASPVRTLAASGASILQTALAADANYIYWGEYGDPAGGPSVWRSADGNTWTRVLGPGTFAARHVHGIFPDPYNAGHVYMTTGDAGSAGYTYRSTDSGATWAPIPGMGTNQGWQAVQLSFTATDIYLAPDTTSNFSAVIMDRATMTPRWLSRKSHRHFPVPAGLPSRYVADLVTTSGSTAVTSATAAFTDLDIGSRIRTLGQDLVPIDSYITSRNSATSVNISAAATASSTNTKAIFGGEAWGAMSYYGAVDPVTNVYYFVTINGGAGGNVDGLFAVTPDGDIALLDVLTTSPDGKIFICQTDRTLWVRGFKRSLISL